MIVVEKGVYVRSEQKPILNRLYRAPRLWHDGDPATEVVFRPVGLICQRKYVSGFIARPIPQAGKCVVPSYDTTTISLSDRIAKGTNTRSSRY